LQVLLILSQIWKSGAEIYLDKTDDRIGIKKQNLIPADVMKAAEQNFPAIDNWFQSWKNASAEKITILKMVHMLCGWQESAKINNWFCNDEDSLMMFIDWTSILARNGWKDQYDDYRQYENDESDKLAKKLYIRAVTYAKKGA